MTVSKEFQGAHAAWYDTRVAKLTAEDGWLNVIGRYWLEDGVASIGSATDNDIVLSSGPAHVGTITQAAGGLVFQADANGAMVLALRPDPANPPKFSLGNLRFEVTTMDGRNALRARDIDAAARTSFKGMTYFPIDPNWRITADWSLLDQPIAMDIDTVAGIPSTVQITHRAVFTHDFQSYALLATHGTAQKPQFVVRDLTSRAETYGASRFLYGEELTDNSIVLDFNKAFNPPCAFTDHAVCPLPPPENILPFRIEAGEHKPH